jgi:hypothetical protein
MTGAFNVTEKARREGIDAAPSDLAHRRMLSDRGEPVLLADWRRVLMMHFEVAADALQRCTR